MTRLYKLLAVDDETSNLQKLRRAFREGFQVFQARSGGEALSLLGQEPVDVIITDQRMPGMTGVELLGQSLSQCPDAIRIILTGYTEADEMMDAINEGRVHRYITKPWEPFTLRQTVIQDLEHQRLSREHQLVEEQLRIAHQVQTRLFPQSFPPFPGLSYSGTCRSAGQIGGDFYDFLKLSDGEFFVAVGDVSGKGISAALLMASLQALLRSHVFYRRDSLPLMMREINAMLRSLTDGSRFATLFCGLYRAGEDRLTYVNAGHNPPLLTAARTAASSLRPLAATGVPLGLFEDAEFACNEVDFRPGDRLIGYTDGVVEAENGSGEQFGEQRLEEAVRGASLIPAAEVERTLLEEVVRFADGRPLTDDLTLIVLERPRTTTNGG